jgi:hypothetical protein
MTSDLDPSAKTPRASKMLRGSTGLAKPNLHAKRVFKDVSILAWISHRRCNLRWFLEQGKA